MTPTAPALSSADRLTRIIGLLCDAVAAEGAKRGLAGPLIILIWTRLRRLARRFAVLAAQTTAARRTLRHRAARGRPQALPRHFAWLPRWLPGTAAAAAQLRHLLAEPDMAALFATAPATGRALRPLCHMLGLRPPAGLRRPPNLAQLPLAQLPLAQLPGPIPGPKAETASILAPLPARSAPAHVWSVDNTPFRTDFAPAPPDPAPPRARASP